MPIKGAKTKQQGFMLVSLMIGILVMLLLAVLGAGAYSNAVYEASAQSTGKYLVSVRGAVLNALATHQAVLTKVDTSTAPSGVYPTSPAWAKFTGDSTLLSVTDLKNSGFLPADFPDRPALGRSVRIFLSRNSASCPGTGCAVTAYVYTCWPLSKGRVSGTVDITTCPTPPSTLVFNGNLVGKAIEATDGFGGSNALNPARVNGALFNLASTDIGLSGSTAGHVVVAASLNATMFNQFVRQGDTRPVFINNQLEASGNLLTRSGFLAQTSVKPGSGCASNGATALSSNETLAMCKSGLWFELTSYAITSAKLAANGETVGTPGCPGPHLSPFTYVSLQGLDVTASGGNVDVQAALTGTIRGTGNVNASGTVSVSGTFTGTASSTSASQIRTAQIAEVINGVLNITPAGTQARALVLQGCRAI